MKSIHQALTTALGIPEKDFFQVLTEHQQGDIAYDPEYLGINRSYDFMVIEFILRRGRSDNMERILYEEISKQVVGSLNIEPDDIMIILTENDHSDWSLGKGKPGFTLSLNHI